MSETKEGPRTGGLPSMDKLVTAAIVANAAVFVWGLLDHHHEQLADSIEHGILVLFIVELVIEMARLRAAFWRNGWHVFDAAVIVLALLPLIPALVTLARLAKVAKLLHLTRHAEQLRTLTRTLRGGCDVSFEPALDDECRHGHARSDPGRWIRFRRGHHQRTGGVAETD